LGTDAVEVDMETGTAAGSAAELRAAYAMCAAEVRRFHPAVWTSAEVLPASVRPSMHALHAFAARSDRIADEGEPAGRARRLALWRSGTMAELRSGRSGHPLRRALVDTACRWDLDHSVFEEFFDALQADCASAPLFETFADARRYLRGVSGTIAELWAPLLGLRAAAAASLSVVGELFQLVDVLEDLPIDLKAGRCYLPRADLRRLGLDVADLLRGERRETLDELMGIQLAYGRELLDQAIPAIEIVEAEYQTFLQTVILGAQVQFDEVEFLRSRALSEGITPLPSSVSSRRCVPPLLGVDSVPDHVAVIMDGNRRWAAHRGLPATQGHRAGGWAMARTVYAALRLGVRHLTVYAFSTENWSRSPDELAALFEALADVIARGGEWLHELGVRVCWSGRRDRLDPSLVALMALLESMTSNNSVLTLTMCVDYGGREELAAAARALAAEAVTGTIRPEEIGPADLARHLYLRDLPDVDLLIRTSGEQRISNFLPWHLAYAELVFDPTPWPDFGLAKLHRAVTIYGQRHRSFGGDLDGHADRSEQPVEPAEPAAVAGPARIG
jgi:undecaprenyl diphosphate synthase